MDILAIVISSLAMLFSILSVVKSKSRLVIKNSDVGKKSIDSMLIEIHSKSRNSAGKIHIHEVEEIMRRITK